MEDKLLEIFKLADSLNENQDQVYAQITYIADNDKTIELTIKSKNDNSYLGNCRFKLYENPLSRWEKFIELFKSYIESTTK